MVWSPKEEKSLIRELATSKARCAAFHDEEVRLRPGLTPWPSSIERTWAHNTPVTPKREIFQYFPFVEMNYTSPAEAASDPRLAMWTFPVDTRLTDVGVYLAMKATTMTERMRLHPYDFISGKGGISHRRVPTGKPVILWAHGLAWIAVARGGFILCGEKLSSRAGWRLNLKPKFPGLPEDAAFFAGIVLAPVDIFPLEPGTFEVELPNHANPAVEDVLITGNYHRKNQTRFCDHWKDLVIDLTPEGPVVMPMYKVPFFKAPCANLSKYPELEFRTDYAPYDLFPSFDSATTDDWVEDFFLFPRYQVQDDSKVTGFLPEKSRGKTTIPASQHGVPEGLGILSNEARLHNLETSGFEKTQKVKSSKKRPHPQASVLSKSRQALNERTPAQFSSPKVPIAVDSPSPPVSGGAASLSAESYQQPGQLETTSPAPSRFSFPNIFVTPEPTDSSTMVQASNNPSATSNMVGTSYLCPFKLAATMVACHPVGVSRAEMFDKINDSASTEELQALYMAYCVLDHQRKKRRKSMGQASEPSSERY